MRLRTVLQQEISCAATQENCCVAPQETSSVATQGISCVAPQEISCLTTQDISCVGTQEISCVATQEISRVATQQISAYDRTCLHFHALVLQLEYDGSCVSFPHMHVLCVLTVFGAIHSMQSFSRRLSGTLLLKLEPRAEVPRRHLSIGHIFKSCNKFILRASLPAAGLPPID